MGYQQNYVVFEDTNSPSTEKDIVLPKDYGSRGPSILQCYCITGTATPGEMGDRGLYCITGPTTPGEIGDKGAILYALRHRGRWGIV